MDGVACKSIQRVMAVHCLPQILAPRLERILELPRICDVQRVLGWKNATGPNGGGVNRVDLFKFAQELVTQDS